MTEIRYYLPDGCPDLARATEGASGFDLRAIDLWNAVERDASFSRESRQGLTCLDLCGAYGGRPRVRLRTGLVLALPLGVEAQVRGRSGFAWDDGVQVHPATIDADYRGEVYVVLFFGDKFVIREGDRVAQLVFAPVLLPDLLSRPVANCAEGEARDEFAYEALASVFEPMRLRRVSSLDEIPPSARGAGGFGSTGR